MRLGTNHKLVRRLSQTVRRRLDGGRFRISARRDEQDRGSGSAQGQGPEAALPLLRQLLLESVEHDAPRQKGEQEPDEKFRKRRCGTECPADDHSGGKNPPAAPVVSVLVILPEPEIASR